MHLRHFKKILFAIVLIAVSVTTFTLFHSKTQTVEAQSESANTNGNVYGFAWSSTTGYVSMNCDQTPTTTLYGFAYTGTNRCTSSGAVGSVDYGVNLDPSTGVMTGYGWSNNIGWVKFDVGTGTPNYALNRAGGARVLSIAAGGTRAVAGWIRFCSDTNVAHIPDSCGNTSNAPSPDNGGWNGWVAMSGADTTGANPFGVTFNTTTNKFAGFAWGGTTNLPGSEVVGWLNFDGVVADLTPPPSATYIPVVKLDSVSPISTGGDTDITYTLQNAPPTAGDAITTCTPFTNGAVGATRDWSTISINPLPSLAPRTEANIWVWAPSTIYYLDCKNALGIHAADPSNPTVQCNQSSPAGTCPRTRVTVSTTSRSLLLLGKGPGQAAFNAGPIQIQAGELVEMQWSSPTNTTLTACEASASPYLLPWDTAVLSDLNAGNSYRATKSGIAPTALVTDFNITCYDAGSAQYISPLRTVQVQILPPTSNLILEVKPNGAPDTLYTQAPSGSPLIVNPNDAVTLRWSSPQNLTNCKGFSDVGVVNWAIPPGGTTKGNLTAPSSTETGVQTQAPSVTYQVTCMDGTTPVTSNTSTVRVDTTPEPILLEIAVDDVTPDFNQFGVPVPSNQNFVRLRWSSNTAIANCVGESIANTNWNNSTVIVSGGAAVERGSITLGSTILPTTYVIICGGTVSSNTVVATPLVPPVPDVGIGYISCVDTTNVIFELSWWTNMMAGGSCTLSTSDAGNSDLSGWDRTVSVLSDGDHWVNELSIDGPTIFYVQCTDADGVTISADPLTIVVDPLCADAPQRSWHFQFFEH